VARNASYGAFRLRPRNARVPAWKKSEQPLESLDKHSACHAEGRGFEPRRSRHFLNNAVL
jgi:hypothetical protein